ncbi:ImmA/IrrE family metallo-endopeptidase [Salipaludibacillus agaradhaerens]|uniref:ImmA/IrrE family metallo-endopeptidase n=1 Tax=Salipaludibacillus agaradhaerens TaxID=76935 RepID=UPI001FE9C5F5|nr:ImmA/IrrE family metallo-endopeptidase [Salipaludibacillus agaradhaerens]
MYTHVEDYINKLFKSIGVKNPTDLDMHTIANKIGVKIQYKEHPFRFNNEVLLSKGSQKQQWMDFGHEVGHYLRHCGSQAILNPLFIELQEWQANNFAYHFCVPTFMLDKLTIHNAYDIVNMFNVDHPFASKRLDMYLSNHFYKDKERYYVYS